MKKSQYNLKDWLRSLEERKTPDNRPIYRCWKLKVGQEFELLERAICPAMMNSPNDEFIKVTLEYAGKEPKKLREAGSRAINEWVVGDYTAYRFNDDGLVFFYQEFKERADETPLPLEVFVCVNSGRFKAGGKK